MPMRAQGCRSGAKEVVRYSRDRCAFGNNPDTMNEVGTLAPNPKSNVYQLSTSLPKSVVSFTLDDWCCL